MAFSPFSWLAALVMNAITKAVAQKVSASVTLAEIDTALELSRKARELQESNPELAEHLRRKALSIEGEVLGGDQPEFREIVFEPTPVRGHYSPALPCPSEEPPPEPRRSLSPTHAAKRRGRPPKNRAVESFDFDHDNNGHIDTD